jgi:hypothetical protein
MTDQETGEPMAERPEPADAGAASAVEGGVAAADRAVADEEARQARPVLERIGLAAIAIVMAMLFGVVAAAAFAGGEYFLAAMGFVGCMMTLAVGGITLLRG